MKSNKLLKDTFSIGINNILLIIFALISSISLARALGPSGQGLVALILVIPAILSKFISLGTQASASYFINSGKYKISEVISNVIITSVVTSILVGAGVIIFYKPNFLDAGLFNISGSLYISLFIALFLLLNFARVNMIGLFFSLEKYKLSNKYNLLNEFLPAVTFVTLWLNGSLSVHVVFIVYILNSLIGLTLITGDYKRSSIPLECKFNPRLFKEFLIYGLPVYYNSMVQTLQQRISLFFLAKFVGLASVGYFSVAYSVAERLNEISKPLVVTHFPKAIQINSDKNPQEASIFTDRLRSKLLAADILLEPVFIVGVILLIPILYSSSYQPSISIAIILSFASISLGQTKMLNNMYAAMAKQNINAYLLTTGLLVNFTLCYLSIRFGYGMVGIAVSTVIAFFASLVLQILTAKIKFNLPVSLFEPDFKGMFLSLMNLKKIVCLKKI